MTAVDAYPDRARNEIYNLLFADDVDALKAAMPEADLAMVAADDEAESRVRAVAFRRLKAEGTTPDGDPPLLGTIVEIALDEGLDTLAAYADGRIRTSTTPVACRWSRTARRCAHRSTGCCSHRNRS